MSGDENTAGARIARARRRRGLSQSVLAGLVGRSESWLSQVERGRRGVDSYAVLTRMAAVLRVEVEELTGPGAGAYPANAIAAVAATLTYDGKNGFRDGLAGHWTGRKWDPDVISKQLAPFGAAGVAGPIPGTGSFWAAGAIPRTGKNVPVNTTNAAIAVYGPLP